MAHDSINTKVYKRLPNRFTSRHVKEINRELRPHLSEHQLKKAAANFCNGFKTRRYIKIVEDVKSFYNIYEKLTPVKKLKTRVKINNKTLLKELPSTFTKVDVFNLLKDRGIPAGEFYLDKKLWNSVRGKISNWKRDYQVRNTKKKEQIITPLGRKRTTVYEKISPNSEKNPLPSQKQSETPATSTPYQREENISSFSLDYKRKMADILRGENPDTDKKEDSHETTQEETTQEFEYILELGDCDSTVVNNGNLYLGNLKISGTFTVTPLKK